ncbi:MAG: protein phosphatase 2C domain-containing protein [Clostridiaceae bacterium]
MKSGLCAYELRTGSLIDIGKTRSSNQDEVIVCPELGFFAVSDGMGGLKDGGKTSYMIREVLPGMIEQALKQLETEKMNAREQPTDHVKPTESTLDAPKSEPLELARKLLESSVAVLSDSIYESGNEGHTIEFGATLCGVWLVQKYALFVNIGDSRGYILKRGAKTLTQVTKDHNIAALLVESGDLTKEQAKHHHTSSRITRFMGMPHPAVPDTFLMEAEPGDILLFCSDGLHGMLEDEQIAAILIAEKDPQAACKLLIDAANEAGGKDNISAVCVRIIKNEPTREAMIKAAKKFSLARLLNPKSTAGKMDE